MNCQRCQWPVVSGSLCDECNRVELFKLAARVAGRAILSQKNLLLRVRLVKKFFGVCINQWETLSILGPVRSVTRLSSSPNTRQSADSV